MSCKTSVCIYSYIYFKTGACKRAKKPLTVGSHEYKEKE